MKELLSKIQSLIKSEKFNSSFESHDFESRRKLLLPVFFMSGVFFFFYYLFLIVPRYGVGEIFIIDNTGGFFIVSGFLTAYFLSKKVKNNWVLALPSVGAVFATSLFLINSEFYSEMNHLWLSSQIIGITFASFLCTWRTNILLMLLNCSVPPLIAIQYNHLVPSEIILKQAVVYFSSLVSIILSFNLRLSKLELFESTKSEEEMRLELLHSSRLSALGEMSAGMAHEINNPLSIISGNLRLLSKFKDNPEKFERSYKKANDSVFRISAIIKQLKSHSRKSSDQDNQETSIECIVQHSLSLTSSKITRHKCRLDTDLTKNLVIKCNSNEIEQVLVNLIINSVDAIKEKDDSQRYINLKSFQDDEGIKLQVIDGGTELTKEIADKIFNPFFTTKPVNKGTGLGLSISKRIVESHGGEIRINSTHPTTCFEIVFKSSQKKAIDEAA